LANRPRSGGSGEIEDDHEDDHDGGRRGNWLFVLVLVLVVVLDPVAAKKSRTTTMGEDARIG
jgi:hypothetical protein